MVGFVFWIVARQGDVAKGLEAALEGKDLSSAAAQKAIADECAKSSLTVYRLKRTLGDKRGISLSAHSAGTDENQTPIWWTFFIWPDGSVNHVQLLKKAELYKTNGSFTEGDTYWRGDRMVVAGSQVNGGNGELAAVSSYLYRGGRWAMVQHLESKQEGFAVFATLQNSVDPSRVLVTTRDYPANLDQPHVGPLLRYQEAWTLRGGAYSRGKHELVYTPLVELDALANYVAKDDHGDFESRVPIAFRDRFWKALKASKRAMSVSNDVYDTTNSFSFGDNGPEVQFQMENGKWVPFKWLDRVKA